MLSFAMLRFAMLCYAMTRYDTLLYAMIRYAMLCYAMLCYATLRYATLHYAYDMLRHAMLCYDMLGYDMTCFDTIPYDMKLHRVISYCDIIIYYIMTWHSIVVSYYMVLYWIGEEGRSVPAFNPRTNNNMCVQRVLAQSDPSSEGWSSPNLPTKIIPTKIDCLKLSGKFPIDMGFHPLNMILSLSQTLWNPES